MSLYLFLGLIPVVLPACVDDPGFNIGYGDCSTYAPGGRNAPYCAMDGATTRCLCSCGQPSGGGGTQSGACLLSNPTCGSGMYCQASGSGGAGTCQPNPVCGVYETLSNCGASCDPKCGSLVSCGANCNPPQPACICASGFARFNGQCIPQAQCAQQSPSTPVSSQGPSQCSSHAMCDSQSYCMSCTKCMLTVGYLYAATYCGACNIGTSTQKSSSCAPIGGCASRQDAIDGTCPTNNPAPACGTNQVYLTCSSLCEPTCGNSGMVCASVCGPPQCQCAPGFVRMNSQCVVPSQCPTPTAPPTMLPPTYAPPTAPSPTPGSSQGSSQCSAHAMCGSQSYCMSCTKCMFTVGYLYAATYCGGCNIGTSAQMSTSCAPIAGCASRQDAIDGTCPTTTAATPPVPVMTACGQNEVYQSCSSLCEPQCGQQNVVCTTACGPPKCQCASGTVRGANNQCVQPSACQQACGVDTCVLQCPQGRVMGSNGCPLCQCVVQQQVIDCSSNPCPAAEKCVALSFACTTWPCQKYTCVGKSGGKPPGAPCTSSTECQSFNTCYKSPSSPTALCMPGSG